MLSYAAIHCGLTLEMIDNYEYPPVEEMADYLNSRNIGYNFEENKPFDWRKKLKSKDLKKYYLACILSKNMGDISKIEELPYADLWTVSFCCQDISIAGRLKGLTEDSNTRSSLVWQQVRLLKKSIEQNKQPKYLMFENVKNLVGKKFKPDFDKLLSILDELGYNTYWQVINAKECGIPQNRERVFAISIRKDIDTRKFTFPKPFDNGLRLKDVLEDTVDEKYYIENDSSKKLIQELLDNGTIGDNAVAVAQRGRYTDDNTTEQQLEIRNDETANCITSVSKDSMIVDHRERESKTIDLSINEPREIDFANCITARYDGGVSTIKQYRTGVVETKSNV